MVELNQWVLISGRGRDKKEKKSNTRRATNEFDLTWKRQPIVLLGRCGAQNIDAKNVSAFIEVDRS